MTRVKKREPDWAAAFSLRAESLTFSFWAVT